jgi:hypothetical protein
MPETSESLTIKGIGKWSAEFDLPTLYNKAVGDTTQLLIPGGLMDEVFLITVSKLRPF